MVDVVVPAVGIVVGEDDHGMVPLRALLDGIDHLDKECLLIKRIGETGVAVAISRGLKEADGGKVIDIERVEEIAQIILMIAAAVIGVSDNLGECRAGVKRVRSRGIELERI